MMKRRLGLLVLLLAGVIVISGCTGFGPGIPNLPNPTVSPAASVQPEPTKLPPLGGGPTLCIQVITPAQNLLTGECRDFSTPCDVPEGWTVGCAAAQEKNVTATILVGESKSVSLNGVEHTVKFLGAESAVEATMQVDRFGLTYLKGRMINVTGTQGKVGVYVNDILVRPAATKETSVTVTLVDLNETFG